MAVEEKRMRQIRDTSTAWANENPTLLDGELGIETDTGSIKVGDGATAWNALPYIVRPAILDNLAASSPPTTIDDTTRGYSAGSRWWVNLSTWWICTDASAGAAVWVRLEAQLPLVTGHDVSLGLVGGQAPQANGIYAFEPLARTWYLPASAAGTVAQMDGGAHTAEIKVAAYARRAAWTNPETRRKLFDVTFPIGNAKGVLSNIDPDLAAGALEFLANDELVIVDDDTANMIAGVHLRVVFEGTVI